MAFLNSNNNSKEKLGLLFKFVIIEPEALKSMKKLLESSFKTSNFKQFFIRVSLWSWIIKLKILKES